MEEVRWIALGKDGVLQRSTTDSYHDIDRSSLTHFRVLFPERRQLDDFVIHPMDHQYPHHLIYRKRVFKRVTNDGVIEDFIVIAGYPNEMNRRIVGINSNMTMFIATLGGPHLHDVEYYPEELAYRTEHARETV